MKKVFLQVGFVAITLFLIFLAMVRMREADAHKTFQPTQGVIEELITTEAEATTEVETETELSGEVSREEFYSKCPMTSVAETTTAMTMAAESTEEETPIYNRIPLPTSLQIDIQNLCRKYDADFELILAIIKTESNFHTDALSTSGSVGLMQIQPKYWQKPAEERGLNLYEPLDNAEMGIIIFTNALTSNGGDVARALKHYNTGNPDSADNTYVNTVMANLNWVKGE